MKSLLLIAASTLVAAQITFTADTPADSAPASTIPDGNVFFTDKAGKHALDPICGMTVAVTDKTPLRDFEGKRYYFCADGCGKAFAEKPGEYLEKLALPAYVTGIDKGKMTVDCAVSREKMVVDAKSPHQVYKGHDYYFCCNKCPKAFAKNPEKFALKDEAQAR